MRTVSTVAALTLLFAFSHAACSSSGGSSGAGGSGGTGGSNVGGHGGASAGTGGASAGTGGASAGTGGASAGTGGASAGTGTPAVIRFGGQFKAFGVGTDSGASGDWTDSDRTKLVPTQTWICAEFEFDGPNNTFHVWWDDMERTMLASGPGKHASFTMPTFNSLWFGWWMYNLAEPQEIWIDEIAVDYKPIGCAK